MMFSVAERYGGNFIGSEKVDNSPTEKSVGSLCIR